MRTAASASALLLVVLVSSAMLPAGVRAGPGDPSAHVVGARTSAYTGPHADRVGPSPPPPVLSWWNVTSESPRTPPVDWFTEATWDAADGYLLSYGGDDFLGTNLNATQTYEGGHWALPKTGGVFPGAIDGPALAFDPRTGHVVMYGGSESYSPFVYTNLTFTYAAGNWSSAHLDPSPPAPTAATMVYDPDLGGVVLFAGYNNSDSTGATLLNDLWLYNGTWSPLPDTSPPSTRTWASMVYDPIRHELVMYGGLSPTSSCLGDTWTYNETWTRITGSSGPTPLFGTEMVYDPDLGGAVLFGGESCKGVVNHQLWEFNGSAWQSVSLAGSPSAHLYGLAAWDPVDRMLLVSGGDPNGSYTDVLSTPLRVADLSGPRTGEVGAPLNFTAAVAGGVPERNLTWSWGDGSPDTLGPAASHTYAQSGDYSVNLSVTDAVGQVANATARVVVGHGLVAQAAACSPVLDLGESCTFTATSSGGVGNVSFSWTAGAARLSGRTVVLSFSSLGNQTVSVTATDSLGANTTANVVVQVVPAVAVGLVGDGAAEVGVENEFTAVGTGGAAPVAFSWEVDSTPGASGSVLTYTFATPGPHLVQVTATDSANATADANLSVTVVPPVSVAVSGPTSVVVGDTAGWSASATSGRAPMTWNWSFSDGGSGTASQVSRSFSTSGAYALTFRVLDALNGTAEATVNVTVTGSGGSGITLAEGLGIGAVIVGAGIVGSVVWVRHRRRPPSP